LNRKSNVARGPDSRNLVAHGRSAAADRRDPATPDPNRGRGALDNTVRTRPVSPSPTCARRSASPARTTPYSSPTVCWGWWG
jgi:hypothetical protein